ncbi:MAG: pentapeptide repeat-containing protein [Cyanobacteria bacterium P01_F01_bin.143]
MDEFEEFIRGRALAEEIIKRYKTGERNFTGIELKNTVISDTCFMDVDFSRVNLWECLLEIDYLVNVSFAYANLEWTSFSASLINCNFSNANLRGSGLKRARLIGVDLTSADLSGADLRGTKLIGCNLRNADLSNIKVDERTIFASTTMPDGSMRTDLTQQIIDAQKLRQRFYGEWNNNFQGIIMHDADLSGIDLHGTWIHPVNMSKAYFSNVNFRDANLSGVDFSRSSFINCDFTGTDFGANGVNLEGAELIDIDFRRTHFSSASFYHARCIRVNFQDTNVNLSGHEAFFIEAIMPDGELISISTV